MKRTRMVGPYELVYEKEMNMYRFMKMDTEEFSAWFSPGKAEELKEMNENDFFATAEKSIQEARESEEEQTGDERS